MQNLDSGDVRFTFKPITKDIKNETVRHNEKI